MLAMSIVFAPVIEPKPFIPVKNVAYERLVIRWQPTDSSSVKDSPSNKQTCPTQPGIRII